MATKDWQKSVKKSGIIVYQKGKKPFYDKTIFISKYSEKDGDTKVEIFDSSLSEVNSWVILEEKDFTTKFSAIKFVEEYIRTH